MLLFAVLGLIQRLLLRLLFAVLGLIQRLLLRLLLVVRLILLRLFLLLFNLLWVGLLRASQLSKIYIQDKFRKERNKRNQNQGGNQCGNQKNLFTVHAISPFKKENLLF